jgi:hypothetical protein
MSEDKTTYKLAVIILDERELLDDLLMGFVDLGVKGATVVDSKGMGQIVRQEIPIFTGLSSLFPETSGSVTIVSVMEESFVAKVFDLANEVVGQLDRPNSAICFSLPIDEFRGLKN